MSSSDNSRRRRRKNRSEPTGRRGQEARASRDSSRNDGRLRNPNRSPSAFDDPDPRFQGPDRRERVQRKAGQRPSDAQSRRGPRTRQGSRRTVPGSRTPDPRGVSRSQRIAGTYGGTYGAEALRYGGTVYAGDSGVLYAVDGGLAESRTAVARQNAAARADSDFTPRRRQKPGKRLKRGHPTLLLAALILAAVLLTANRLLFQKPIQQMEPVSIQAEEPERVPFSSVAVIPEELRNLEVRENTENETGAEDIEEPEPEPEMEAPVQEAGSKTRKEDFFTILLAGADDNNGGSDTI
ncbi:MAG: hypothetical protein IJT94_08080, partial [Oscillibacter sp.]|nr:hypothetical protein [Oscillibacter sp.]